MVYYYPDPQFTLSVETQKIRTKSPIFTNQSFKILRSMQCTEPSTPKLQSTLSGDGQLIIVLENEIPDFSQRDINSNKNIIQALQNFFLLSSITMHSVIYCDSILTELGLFSSFLLQYTHTLICMFIVFIKTSSIFVVCSMMRI